MTEAEAHTSRPAPVGVALLFLSAACLGLLTGGMLLIGVSLVSLWRAMPPTEFIGWFSAHSHLIGRLMIPLGAVTALLAVAAAAASWTRSVSARWPATVAALCALAIGAMYPLFFAAANASFERGDLAASAVSELLDRWAIWHWVRTTLGAVGFVAALRALRK